MDSALRCEIEIVKTHGFSIELWSLIEPMFIKYGVDVLLSGHEHIYETSDGADACTVVDSGVLRRVADHCGCQDSRGHRSD